MSEPALAIAEDPAESAGTLEITASPELAALQPLAVDVATAAALFGITQSSWYHADRCGLIGPEKLPAFGKARRYDVEELRAWCRAGTPPRAVWIKRNRLGEQGGSE